MNRPLSTWVSLISATVALAVSAYWLSGTPKSLVVDGINLSGLRAMAAHAVLVTSECWLFACAAFGLKGRLAALMTVGAAVLFLAEFGPFMAKYGPWHVASLMFRFGVRGLSPVSFSLWNVVLPLCFLISLILAAIQLMSRTRSARGASERI